MGTPIFTSQRCLLLLVFLASSSPGSLSSPFARAARPRIRETTGHGKLWGINKSYRHLLRLGASALQTATTTQPALSDEEKAALNRALRHRGGDDNTSSDSLLQEPIRPENRTLSQQTSLPVEV